LEHKIMAGIINNALAQQGAQVQPAAPANPRAVQRIVSAGTKVLNQDAIEQQILQIVQAGNTPAEGLAQAVVLIMEGLHAQSRGTMPKGAMATAAQQIIAVIVKMCQAAGILPPEVPPQLVDEALGAVAELLQQEGKGEQPQPAAPPAAPAAVPQGV
jgi:hypothetical protein